MATREKSYAMAAIFFAAVCLKYLIFGFCYYPVLDDFIQYGGYPLYGDLGYVYFGIGTMAARPLASLLDPLLWGGMWGFMGLALFLISVLHFSAVCLMSRTLRRCGFSVSPLFWVLALFLPVGAEGAYWISASSRLVVGLFFAALSLYFLVRALTEEKRLFGVLFVVFHFISYGFYEAVAIFSFLGVYLVALCHFEKARRKWWIFAVPVVSMLALLLYYAWGANLGAMGSRAGGFTFSGLSGKLREAIWQLGRIFTKGLWQSTVKGFFAGLRVVVAQGFSGALWLILALWTCFLVWRESVRRKTDEKSAWALFWCGLLLFVAPIAPNVLVETVWLPYRTVFVSLIGLALMAEPIFRFVLRNRRLQGLAVALGLFVCLMANVNLYDTYRRVSEYDTQMAQSIAERLDEDVLAGQRNAIVILEQPTDIYQVDFYKDCVKSVMEADWSLTGAVRAVTKNMNIKKITPVLAGQEQIADEQVLFLGADGHITDITVNEE